MSLLTLEKAFLVCSTHEHIHEFLIDLLTPGERAEFLQRLHIAQQLHQGVSYKTIEQQTGASSTTIARVAKFLQREKSGYQTVFTNISNLST